MDEEERLKARDEDIEYLRGEVKRLRGKANASLAEVRRSRAEAMTLRATIEEHVEANECGTGELRRALRRGNLSKVSDSRIFHCPDCQTPHVRPATKPSGSVYCICKKDITPYLDERIEAAAIKIGDAIWTLPKPARHAHIIRAYVHVTDEPWIGIGGVQGFVTSAGRFVDREEAASIVGAEQPLFSEDLW